jgi:MFS transporter, FSR family, fosmidomycin resistance protein
MKPTRRPLRRILRFLLILLVIEFLDELIYGVREAAWPLLRADLQLSYTQVGLLISVPGIIGNLVEPILGILADTWKRRVLILGGGCVFIFAAAMAAASNSFLPLLLAYILSYPASGAYVSLSQAVMMDLEPERHEQNMARWTFAGSLGVVAGPLLMAGAVALGWGWRAPFWAVAGFGLLVLVISWQAYRSRPEPVHAPVDSASPAEISAETDGAKTSFWQGLRGAGQALKRKEVLRWLTLLQFSELMLDTLYSFLALYLVDVAGLPAETGVLAVSIWTGVGLLGDFLLIPLIERVPGLAYLWVSAVLELILFPTFLLAPSLPIKLVALGLLGFFNSGWYSILQGQLYSSMPGQSGTVMTLGDLTGLVGQMVPLAIGLLAQRFGLSAAMWVLILGPIALLIGLPRVRNWSLRTDHD